MPEILDVHNLIDLILRMGVKVTHCGHGFTLLGRFELDRDYINSRDYIERCSRLRGSVLLVGPCWPGGGRAYFPKPGEEDQNRPPQESTPTYTE